MASRAPPGPEGGQGRVRLRIPGAWWLVAIDPASDRLAGAVRVWEATGEIGGHLAPRFRGRGLGSDLFAGGAQFAHQHLGIGVVTAGTEQGNSACIRALASAGFAAAQGADTHTLPDGRVVPARWFRHISAQPALCRPAA